MAAWVRLYSVAEGAVVEGVLHLGPDLLVEAGGVEALAEEGAGAGRRARPPLREALEV